MPKDSSTFFPDLPVAALLPAIADQFDRVDRMVIQAPPGAGKTTLIPLQLLNQFPTGRLLLIQPRRLAVYGAARQLARLLGEQPGEQVGWRTRYDRCLSPKTRLEVLTDGLFLRQIQQDPELRGVSLVIFDEYHERSVAMELGLAFALDAQTGLRDPATPLKLVLMSATLDGQTLADRLGATLLVSEGRCHPVQTRYVGTAPPGELAQHTVRVIRHALQEESGSLLVFLPGWSEIRQVQRLLEIGMPADSAVFPLHASLSPAEQEQAIAPPAPGQRKIVLATNVAETSLTIKGIRVVVDSGLVRVAHYDPWRGLDSLRTERISQASAEQRRGRAGRLTPGVCYRLWPESDQARLRPFAEPQIRHCDLLPVALELATWGVTDCNQLHLPDPPPSAALAEARRTLSQLGALDGAGHITALGRHLVSLGVSPRLALLMWEQRASPLASAAVACAAVLSEGDPLRFPNLPHEADLHWRLALWQPGQRRGEQHNGTWRRIQQLAQDFARRCGARWQADATDHPELSMALARAFPEQVAQRREQSPLRYRLANGRGAQLGRDDSLAGTPWLVVLDGRGPDQEPWITLACTLTEEALIRALGDRLERRQVIRWNEAKQRVEAEQQLCIGALVVRSQPLPRPWPAAARDCLLEAVRRYGLGCLPWSDACRQWQARIGWLRRQALGEWPDLSDFNLTATLEDWLAPALDGLDSLADLQRLDLHQVLLQQLDWPQHQWLEQRAPAQFLLPTGTSRTLDYDPEQGPILRERLQAFFGLTQHPCLPNGQPLLLELLSPAGRPLQITRDLPGFWRGSYIQVAKEMRGRYPRHPWPDDPTRAEPTLKAKPRSG
jgi:ATP-dependent helicase HrpB